MLASAAGLFEGEGSVTRCRRRLRLRLKMTDEEPVRRFAAAFQGSDGSKCQPFWYWVAEAEDALDAIDPLRPLVVQPQRLNQIDVALPFE
jgi:hypothetical protein